MIKRGLYELNYRGLNCRELWRFSEGKPFALLIALGLKITGKRGIKCWLPARENEANCSADDLSESAKAKLLPVVEQARALGYENGRYTKLVRRDDPSAKEGWSYAALHRDGVRTLFLAFAVMKPENQKALEKLTVVGAINLVSGASIAFTSERVFLDGAPNVERIFLKDGSVASVDRAMADRAAKSGYSLLRFDGWEALKQHADDATDLAFAARIRRGLYVWVSGERSDT